MKATGLEGDASAEIISIIDDDMDAFGDRAGTHTMDEPGGPGWVGPVAAAALVALIGYGVATSASSSSAPKVAPASTSLAPSTTQPSPTTTVAPPLVPYYAADPPREFTVQHAQFQDPGRNYYGPGNYQLWAIPGASATSGGWFSIESIVAGPDSVYAVNAYRVQSGERSMAISHSSTGQSIAQFSVNRSVAVTLTSFGLSDEDLARLAQSVTVDGPEAMLSDASLIPGLEVGDTVFRACGCAACHGQGYRGRSGIYEVVAITREIEALIYAGASEADLTAQARRDGPGLIADGLRQIRAGLTTVEDVARVAQEA